MGDIQPEINSTITAPSSEEEISNKLLIQCADQEPTENNSRKPTPDVVPGSLISEQNQIASNLCVHCKSPCQKICTAAGRPECARAAEQVANKDSDSDLTEEYVTNQSSQPEDNSPARRLTEIEQEEQATSG
ncbi:uncharacterized protein LOC120338474 [Styela clava]